MIKVNDQIALYTAIGMELLRAGFTAAVPAQVPAYDEYGCIENDYTLNSVYGDCRVTVLAGDPAAVTADNKGDGALSKGISIYITVIPGPRYVNGYEFDVITGAINFAQKVTRTILYAADPTYKIMVEGDEYGMVEFNTLDTGEPVLNITNDVYFWDDED